MGAANAQTSGNNETSLIQEDYVRPYSSEYPLWSGEAINEAIAIQVATHLAKQGGSIAVRGDVHSYVLDEIDTVTRDLNLSSDWRANCTVDVFSQDGILIAQYSARFTDYGGDGDFISVFLVEPEQFLEGQTYTVKPGFNLASSVMDAVNPEVYFYLTTLPESEFMVENPSIFKVLAENRTFDVPIASNSIIKDFSFNQSEKKISFTVEANAASRTGVAQLAIPSELLWGGIMILRDGLEIPRNEAILAIQEDIFYVVEVNYSHDEQHTIEILGTTAIPEFPVSTAVITVSAALIVSIALFKKRFPGRY